MQIGSFFLTPIIRKWNSVIKSVLNGFVRFKCLLPSLHHLGVRCMTSEKSQGQGQNRKEKETKTAD